jgi:type II secretory pathway pseudopilin PulG
MIYLKPSSKTSQRGFIMPTVIIMMLVMMVLSAVTMQVVISNYSLAKRQAYLQIAQVASKSAIDYAKEQFEADPNYNGTSETELANVGKYRVTFQVTVTDTSADGLEKNVQGYGNVYVPETSPTARFVRDIKAQIIRRGTVSGDPTDYSPSLWLDASDETTLLTSTVNSITRTATSTKEEKTSGYHSIFSWFSNDLEFFDGFILGLQRLGARFANVAVPAGANITEAYLQFQVDETGNSQGITAQVNGIDTDSKGNFAAPLTMDELKNAPLTTASTVWAIPTWNVVGQSGAAQRTPDLSDEVQEIVNRGGWSSGNGMAFVLRKNGGGSGLRVAEKNPVNLYVEWDGGGTAQAGDNESVVQWNDKSGNGNNAVLAYGNAPIKRDAEQNGEAVVEFNNDGALRSPLSTAITSESLTAFIVTRPKTTTYNNGRFLSAMNAAQENDWNTESGAALFRRVAGTANVDGYHNSQTGPSASAAINDSYGVFSSLLSDPETDVLHHNGTDYELAITNNYEDLEEIFVGGRRCGAAGCEYVDAYIAEVILYDYALGCNQIQAIEGYLAEKWGVTQADYTCPATPTDPVL